MAAIIASDLGHGLRRLGNGVGIAALATLAIVATGCVAGPGASAPGGASTRPAQVVVSGDPSVITPAERQEQALTLEPISGVHPRARITEDLAVERAREFLVEDGDLLLVEHGMAEPLPQQPRISVWLVVFSSSRVVHVGPANASHGPGGNVGQYRYEGVLIDDQTGELVRGFAKGVQIPAAS